MNQNGKTQILCQKVEFLSHPDPRKLYIKVDILCQKDSVLKKLIFSVQKSRFKMKPQSPAVLQLKLQTVDL